MRIIVIYYKLYVLFILILKTKKNFIEVILLRNYMLIIINKLNQIVYSQMKLFIFHIFNYLLHKVINF
jgi:hypothetical protein